jgi:SAM-dependent methyltransferase
MNEAVEEAKTQSAESGSLCDSQIGPPVPGLFETALELVRKYVAPGQSVAELCAGSGAFSSLLVDAGFQVVPVDGDTRWFNVPRLEVVEADLNGPFATLLGRERFDCITCLEGIEHLENPWHFIRQCRALLRPKGILLISTPNVECLLSRLLFLRNGGFLNFDRKMRVPYHITPIISWLLSYNLKKNGFVEKEAAYLGSGWTNKRGWPDRLVSGALSILSPLLERSLTGETRIVVAAVLDDL